MFERYDILLWLSQIEDRMENSDPRGIPESALEESLHYEEKDLEHGLQGHSCGDSRSSGSSHWESSVPPFLELIPLCLKKKWCFTIGDPDFYPSIPHGHLNSKTNSWPKLNPYTGKAYNESESIDKKLTLTRNEMIDLWNDNSFRDHALRTIRWYIGEYQNYQFPVNKPLKLPKMRKPKKRQ